MGIPAGRDASGLRLGRHSEHEAGEATRGSKD